MRELAAGNSGVPEPGKRTSLKQLSSALPDAVTALAARKAANKAAKLPYSSSDMLEELDALAQAVQRGAQHGAVGGESGGCAGDAAGAAQGEGSSSGQEGTDTSGPGKEGSRRVLEVV